MYNRYIPNADGSYRKNSLPEPEFEQEPPCSHTPREAAPCRENSCPPPAPLSPGAFFRQLLPAGVDTADLMIVLLLLLMAADRQSQGQYALLTLALYFMI